MITTDDDIIRKFWATFLDSKVDTLGTVAGFRSWWDHANDWERKQADIHASAVVTKVRRDGRNQDECIAAGAAALRRALANPPAPELPSRPEYARFRIELLARIGAESLLPIQVARILESAADRFPEITYEECRRYREMNDVWQPWDGPPLPPERVAQIRAQLAAGIDPGTLGQTLAVALATLPATPATPVLPPGTSEPDFA